MRLTTNELLLYVSGNADADLARRCQAEERDPNSFLGRLAAEMRPGRDTDIQLDWAALAQADGGEVGPRRNGRSFIGSVACVFAIACCALIAIYYGLRATTAESNRADLQAKALALEGARRDDAVERNRLQDRLDEATRRAQAANLESIDIRGRLDTTVAALDKARRAEEITGAADRSDPTGLLVSISFERPAAVDAEPAAGSLKANVLNDFFPCRVSWKTDKGHGEIDVPIGDSKLTLPTGEVRVSFEPAHGFAWFQPFGIVHNNRYLGTTLGPVLLDLGPEDKVQFRLDQPFAPWNSAMVRIKGLWAIVTLERPSAAMSVDDFKNGKWGGSEKLPNSMLFWASDGSEAMARELASFFIDHRGDKGRLGKFRGAQHTSIIVPAGPDKVSAPFDVIGRDELTSALTEAFEILRKQRPPAGRTFEEELVVAKQILPTLTAPKGKK